MVKVYVPFKYDLGGRVADNLGFRNVMLGLFGEVDTDHSVVRSWNISYLAQHPPVLRSKISDGYAMMAGTRWKYHRVARVFPWLGIISFDYMFEPERRRFDITRFYDEIVQWKNNDYLPYLSNCGAMTPDLMAHAKSTSGGEVEDLHASLVVRLREAARPYIHSRPSLYAFHDFRLCYIDPSSTLKAADIQSLLLLTKPGKSNDSGADVVSFQYGSVHAMSTGWSTVFRTTKHTKSDELEFATCLSLLSFIHAQWFLCQIWINIYDLSIFESENAAKSIGTHEISRSQLALAHDLTEVGTLNLMLKDPALLRAARALERSFAVLDHRAAAERGLRVLENYSKSASEFSNEIDLKRLQILFSLSAAGSIAALIPALVQIDIRPIPTIATIFVLIALWLGFAINFALLARRLKDNDEN